MLARDLGCQWAWGVVLFYGVVPCGVGWCGHSAPTLCCSHSRRALYEDSGAASELAWLPASELVWIPASLFDTRANNRSSNRSPSYCGTVNKLPETHYINPFLLARNDLVSIGRSCGGAWRCNTVPSSVPADLVRNGFLYLCNIS